MSVMGKETKLKGRFKMTYSLVDVKAKTEVECLTEMLIRETKQNKICHQAITHLEKENENITNMYLAQVELTGKYNQERKELQEAYEGIKEELKRAHSYIRMEEED